MWLQLCVLRANTDEKAPVFELVIGRTEQTNKLSTFRLETEGTTAHIRLARHLDFESVSEYILTVRIQVRENTTALKVWHQVVWRLMCQDS